MTRLAVAVLGPDRPGVIAALTEVLLRDGGNLEDASMTLLRGQFAMTLIVDVDESAAEVSQRLQGVSDSLDLLVSVRETSPESDDLRPPSASFVLRVHGADRPGLLHRMTSLLASYDVNVTDLSTRLVGAAAAPVYVMLVSCEVPTSAPLDGLQRAIVELASELEVEATLRPVDGDLF